MKLFLSFLILVCLIQADETDINIEKEAANPQKLTFNWISSLKKDIKRDFYINEYLKTDITPEQSLRSLELVDNLSNDMFLNFAKKFKHDETLAVAQCIQMDTKYLVDSYADCIVNGLSLKDATTISSLDIDSILQKTSVKYPVFSKNLKVISSSIPFTKLIISRKDDFYNIYLNVDDKFRTKYFNYKLPKRTFKRIFEDKSKFNEFINVSLTNPNMHKIHKSLLKVDDADLSSNSSFLLALNAIKYKDLNLAYDYLNKAIKKEDNIKNQNKYTFWLYKITKNEEVLESLSNSLNLNIYSVYANEFLNKSLNDTNFLNNLESFEKYSGTYDFKRVALLYAIAQVKSEFNSDKISDSFEVGIMQLQTSFIKTISTLINEEYNISGQFQEEESLKYSTIHLNNLEKLFSNPLYLFLAYEGKTEFLNTNIKNGLFSKKTAYEPYMSFELLSNKNEYLKDFILYHYFYHNNKANEKQKISLSSIFESLMPSDLTLDEKE